MQTILELIKQRRVWAAIVGFIAFAITTLNIKFDIDVPLLTGLLSDFGMALAAFVAASLALWSYIKPKL